MQGVKNFNLEACQDSPTGGLKLVTNIFHCELAALHCLLSLSLSPSFTLVKVGSLCSLLLYGCGSSVFLARLGKISKYTKRFVQLGEVKLMR